MSTPPPTESTGADDDLLVRANIWIERGGRVVISDFRARLLEAVAKHGSVARAAAALDLPYRTAWKKLDEMEAARGAVLVDRDAGGSGGGHSQLSEAGATLLRQYRELTTPVTDAVEHGARQLGIGVAAPWPDPPPSSEPSGD